MESVGLAAAQKAAEQHLRDAYGDDAHIVRHIPMYPTSAPATQIEPTPPLEIWVFEAERSDGQALTLIASRSSAGWSVVENA
jgi:hypothetical protein